MEQNRLDRAISVAAGAGTDAVLLAHPSAVTWLTGYAAKIETGPSPFALSALAALACPCSPIWSRDLGRPASGGHRARV